MATKTSETSHRAGRDGGARDWRCRKCFKLLGRREERRVHVQFARGHRYIVSAPASAVCRCCGTLNELL